MACLPRSLGKPPTTTFTQDDTVAQPNYQYEKRQKDLAKKKKKEEKLQRKLASKEAHVPENATQPPQEEATELSSEAETQKETP